MKQEPLVRRQISSALQERRGWECTTSEDGYVFVRPPGGGDLPKGFHVEVRTEVEALGFKPKVFVQFRNSKRWVRVSTPETLAQAPRGEHRK